MKQFIYIALISLSLFSCNEKKSRYVITGELTGLQNPKLFFVISNLNNQEVRIDSVLCDKNGKFLFRGTGDKLTPVIIYMENGSVWTTVWAQNTDIIVTGDARYPELILAYGGEVNDLLTDFKQKNADLLKEKRELSDNYSTTMDTDSLNPEFDQTIYHSRISTINSQLKDQTEIFIAQFPSSVASLILIRDFLMDTASPQSVSEYLSKITGEATLDPLYNKLVNINSQILLTVPGAPAPDFAITDIKNDTIRLDLFKGKYFLLSFAASWCDMCNKNYDEWVDLRKSVSKNKLEMLTVSLDGDSTAWTNIAKEKDFTWYQVIDSLEWNSNMVSLYNIMEIPSNVLIDKESNIIGKNLPNDSIMKIVNLE